jgi:hypothetical protein
MSIRFIRLAHEAGLGIGTVQDINLVGDDISQENWGFHLDFNTHRILAWLAWYGPTRMLQKLVLRTPLVKIPTLIGEIEQDYIYWPLKYRPIAECWMRETDWGRLFTLYRTKGVLAG